MYMQCNVCSCTTSLYDHVPGITDYFVIISDSELLIPHCSMYFALHISDDQFAIAYTISKLRESKYEDPRNEF